MGQHQVINNCNTGVQEGGKREKRPENLFEEIIPENFPNLEKETDVLFQEEQRVPNKMNQRSPHQVTLLLKWKKIKDKERILKTAREKQLIMYKGTPIRQLADFSGETL